MRAWIGIVAFSAMAWLSTGPLMAQDRPPEKPEGTMLGEADHRQNVSQFVVFEFHNPAVGVEGFSTYWPDGTKLRDGRLVHNLGSWRIDGERFCTTMRIPADSKERCIRSYKTGDNAYQAWREDGSFAGYWRFRK